MISIGIDLHIRNSYITAIDSESGEIFGKVRVANSNEAIRAYFRQFEGQEVSVVLEATTNTYPMVNLLGEIPEVKEVRVVNPRKMRIIADSVCKTDEIDSGVLAEFGLSRLRLPESYIPSPEVHDLRCELRSRAALVAIRTELKVRVHTLLNGEGFFQTPSNLFGKRGRQWLCQLMLPKGVRRRLDCLLRSIEAFDQEIARVDEMLRKFYARHPRWEEDVKILVSMPGIGLLWNHLGYQYEEGRQAGQSHYGHHRAQDHERIHALRHR